MSIQPPTQTFDSIYDRDIERPIGWKYKSMNLGSIKLPWYASPETQLILVSFVCFLCPGKAVSYILPPQATEHSQACSMLLTALVVQVS